MPCAKTIEFKNRKYYNPLQYLSAYVLKVSLCLLRLKSDVKFGVNKISLLRGKDLSLPLVQGHHELMIVHQNLD